MRRLFEAMERREVELMLAEIQRAGTVVGWYCPTAFWPAFNRIQGARLVCLPDAVSAEFPAEFGAMLPSQATILDAIMETMAGVQHVVTYSQHIRDAVASGVFGIDPSRVTVIRHAPNDLSSHVAVNGFDNSDSASRSLAEGLIQSALRKASGRTSLVPRRSLEFTFLFYASQFRPSKNIVSLLRAYEFLLRQKFIGHKLILTGHGDDPAVSAFMKEHQLEREVLCLHGVSDAELAALYSGAVLAVNPSLSEGGMPFTFTEALSVGTPVVMGDIAVTSEVLTDPALRETMLFDPYDWRSIADKIQWALENRSLLLEKQRRYYQDVLAKRTWADVVKEHLDLLDDLARQRQ
jgi:glycosyltransferase involved in cell wall biosynthesis